MTKITFLGTASAVPDKDHYNTHFLIENSDRLILVDCSGNPFARFDQVNIDPLRLTDVIITHFHPDHVSGLPLLLMDLWLAGKKDPINLYGLSDVIDRVESMMRLFDWDTWEGFYPVNLLKLGDSDVMPLIKTDRIVITASPTCHIIPSICLRFDFPEGVVCYSGDTAPCENVIRLAQDADILIHEASGEYFGHTSALQAGDVAHNARARSLHLVHYPPDSNPEKLIGDAQQVFSGEVVVVQDLMKIVLD